MLKNVDFLKEENNLSKIRRKIRFSDTEFQKLGR